MSNNGNLIIDLEKRIDENGNTFYVGKLQGPFTISTDKDGVCFLVFIANEGEEQLQIAPIKPRKDKIRYDNR